MKRARRFIGVLAVAAFAISAWALPTTADVQAEVKRGNYAQAESMMLGVVTARPTSAKAHYIYAEILAHNKHFNQAVEEAAQAKRIDPALAFTEPAKFRAFEQLLEREQSAARRAAAPAVERVSTPSVNDRAALPQAREQAPVERSSGTPGWVWVLGAAAIAFVGWRLLGARNAASASAGGATPMATNGPAFNPGGYPGAPTGPVNNAGYGAAYPPPPAARGGGLLGTGMAVAGGVAAGMLAEKMFEGHRDGGAAAARADNATPGLFGGSSVDDAAAHDLEQRDVDFGSGNDWGGSDSSSSSDGGSSGGDW